jgi:hypothetical protein
MILLLLRVIDAQTERLVAIASPMPIKGAKSAGKKSFGAVGLHE